MSATCIGNVQHKLPQQASAECILNKSVQHIQMKTFLVSRSYSSVPP